MAPIEGMTDSRWPGASAQAATRRRIPIARSIGPRRGGKRRHRIDATGCGRRAREVWIEGAARRVANDATALSAQPGRAGHDADMLAALLAGSPSAPHPTISKRGARGAIAR
ncbi:MAG TPA: hypothetical protein PLG77_10795 [Burkholderiaceae bacterium]|nr:hypothetical protein [Burkholderiaceae bacterium]